MIELRWLTTKQGYRKYTSVLQYRYAIKDDGPTADVYLVDAESRFWQDHKWSEWKDVPEVDSEQAEKGE